MRTFSRLSAIAAAVALVATASGCTERTSPPGEEDQDRPLAPPQARQALPAPTQIDRSTRIASAPDARAVLEPVDGSSVGGTVSFEQRGETLHISALVTGLAAGIHGFHLHENGDCAGPHADAAGGHFAPAQNPHGGPSSEPHHAGDLGNLTAPFGGAASKETDVDQLTLNGERGVVGRAVVVHMGEDDLSTQPSGASGDPVACGVVRAVANGSDRAGPSWIAGQSFADLDVDADGFLSAAESAAIPALRNIFSLADHDQDGRLNVPEFSHATLEGTRVSADAARGPLFLTLDLDENGRITPEEAKAVPQLQSNFSILDVDGNNNLDEEEYAAALDEGLTPND